MIAKRKLKFLLLLAMMVTSFSLFAESADTAALNKRNKFIETAKQFLGVPYVYGGTSRSGIDCSGLVFLAGKGEADGPVFVYGTENKREGIAPGVPAAALHPGRGGGAGAHPGKG